VSKKTGKLIKSRKLKKPNRKKNQLNQLEFLKNRPVQFGFGFISMTLKKSNRTEPKQKKTSQTGKKPIQTEKIEPNRFLF
jgi:hypothetical protein